MKSRSISCTLLCSKLLVYKPMTSGKVTAKVLIPLAESTELSQRLQVSCLTPGRMAATHGCILYLSLWLVPVGPNVFCSCRSCGYVREEDLRGAKSCNGEMLLSSLGLLIVSTSRKRAR